MTQPHHHNRYSKDRKKYKIHNWRSYERSLINFMASKDVFQSWNSNLNCTQILRLKLCLLFAAFLTLIATTIKAIFDVKTKNELDPSSA